MYFLMNGGLRGEIFPKLAPNFLWGPEKAWPLLLLCCGRKMAKTCHKSSSNSTGCNLRLLDSSSAILSDSLKLTQNIFGEPVAKTLPSPLPCRLSGRFWEPPFQSTRFMIEKQYTVDIFGGLTLKPPDDKSPRSFMCQQSIPFYVLFHSRLKYTLIFFCRTMLNYWSWPTRRFIQVDIKVFLKSK